MADAPRITVQELKRRMGAGEDFTVIDVRNPHAWAEAKTVIPEAIRVPSDELEKNLPRIPKNKPVVAYCTGPSEGSSASLAQKLQERGYKDVWTLKGGLQGWESAGYQVEPKRDAA